MRNLRLSLITVTLLASAGTAWAILPPSAYQEARVTALYHLQLQIVDVTAPAKGPGVCQVRGTLVRIFRDRKKALKLKQALTLPVDCRRPGDEIPDGPVIWKTVAELQKGKVLEAFVNPDGKRGVTIARWQSEVLEKASDKPAMDGNPKPGK